MEDLYLVAKRKGEESILLEDVERKKQFLHRRWRKDRVEILPHKKGGKQGGGKEGFALAERLGMLGESFSCRTHGRGKDSAYCKRKKMRPPVTESRDISRRGRGVSRSSANSIIKKGRATGQHSWNPT